MDRLQFYIDGAWVGPATPRALSQGLSALGKRGLVRREVIDMRPPTSRYDLTRSGQLLAEACAV